MQAVCLVSCILWNMMAGFVIVIILSAFFFSVYLLACGCGLNYEVVGNFTCR